MSPGYDIVIRNARLRRTSEGQYDIGVKAGQISAIERHLAGSAALEIDAKGCLTTESFVNPHLHLCKVYTLEMMDGKAMQNYHGAGMGRAMSAIEQAALIKDQYDEGWIIENVRRAVALAAVHGNTHLRALADVDSKARLEGLKALLRARDEFAGIVDIQVVAFAQDGILREPGTERLLRQSMDLGADVVGGIPWIEYTETDMRRHVEIVFDIAQEYNAGVSMLVDDAGDPGLRTLELMAVETLKRGWQGRALAHHGRAMALYPEPYLQRLVALLKRADMAVVTDPHTGPLHARIKELLAQGVTVCLGQDDISDAYYPFGRNNLLEVAFLASHLLWMTKPQELEVLYDMVTVEAARAMGLSKFGLKVGTEANLVILEAPNVLEALRSHQRPKYVISHGKPVDQPHFEAMAAKQSNP